MANGPQSAGGKDVVLVVGAGLAGLATASILNARGLRATVLETTGEIGGRVRPATRDGFRLDAAWAVERKEPPLALALADAKAPALATVPLKLKVVADRAGALGTGSLGFIAGTRAASLNGRLSVRSSLGASARNHERLDYFLESQGLKGSAGALMRALAGAAGADPRARPSAAFALARELVLERRSLAGVAGGFEKCVRDLAATANVETHRAVERLALDAGHVRGVVLAGGEERAASHVVLALPAPAARALFSDADWMRVPSDERIRFEAAVHRSALVVGWKMKEPLREPLFALVGDPAAYVVAASAIDASTAPAGRGLLLGIVGMPQEAPRDGARLDAIASALEKAAAPLVSGFAASVEGRELALREVDDPAYALAGGRDRPVAAIGGFDNLYLAGEATDAPYYGAERALASARSVARLIAPA